MNFGIVVIGRNEGERLYRCLLSILRETDCDILVYVDSGSTDGSVELAHSLGLNIVSLDKRTPFSAGRARNEGFSFLVNRYPELRLIQFVDGDCELCEGWFETACDYLSLADHCGVVAGRTIEKYPERSLYNLLCDLEWRTAFGSVPSCGGIFMVRSQLFREVGGFNPAVSAGEEPELCFRLRQLGWEIHRLDVFMVIHDAAMTHFAQWWKRSVRSGYAYAQGYALHGKSPEKYYLKDSMRIWLWGLLVPGLILTMSVLADSRWLALLVVYPIQIWRMATAANKRFNNMHHSFLFTFFTVLAKWPQLCGQILFWTRKVRTASSLLIEYK
ncbi:MAG: glycosyltransferase [Bacteroidia bacterium]|nr:glycosyltransferase [Bacteroidia bacterium]